MNYLQLIIKCMIVMHKGTAILKLKSAFMLALLAAPFAMIGEEALIWLKLNIEFIGFVFGAVVIDHLFGSYVHAYIKKDFTIKKNIQGFMTKTALIIAVFFLGRGMVSILGNESTIAIYFRTIMRMMVFLYPASSALVNCSIITKGKFPPLGFMNKLKRFNEEMDLKQFKGGLEDTEGNTNEN